MGALFVVRDGEDAEAAIGVARSQFGLHGFPAPLEQRVPGWRLLHASYIIGGPETFHQEGDDFVAVAGTFLFDGLMGAAALGALLQHAELPSLDWSRIGGQFAAFVRKNGRNFLFTDFFGAFQLFRDAGGRLFSTSLLAAVGALPSVSFDAQGLYEYAFHVSILGDDTVFRELKRLGPDRLVELTSDGQKNHPLTKPLAVDPARRPVADHLERSRKRLGDFVGAHVARFGNHVQCPLSGGLDSRLLLALLRSQGSHPHSYVYGSAGDADVTIAQTIARAEGFEVEWIDKARYRDIDPDAFVEQVERNYQENDALPNFGGLFDNGGNSAARDSRHGGGALAASGGCGEIYRNFFYLPDRPLTAGAVTRSFFSRFDARDATGEFDERRFLRATEDKILTALELPGERKALPRTIVEQVYPRVRGRGLFGREISIEGRYGAYMMPFLDHQTVREALALPMKWKECGVFEAQLLASIDPVLAGHPSAYGHDFVSPPSFSHRFSEWSTRVRPVLLRQKSYAIQRRLRPMADEHGGLLSPDYMGRVIDLDFPLMRRWFHMDRITDSGLWRRIAALEYLAERLGSKLAA